MKGTFLPCYDIAKATISRRQPPSIGTKMSKSTYYPPNILKEFIALYRNLPCLWQISSRGYKDKQLKKRAYEILVEKLREVNVNADREEVSRRINILRTSFRREYKKALKLAIKYPKSRFKSSLWYYDLMKFVEEDKGEPMEDNISKTEPNEVFIESMDYNEDMVCFIYHLIPCYCSSVLLS